MSDAIAVGGQAWTQAARAVALGGGLDKEGTGALVKEGAESAVAIGGATDKITIKAAQTAVAQGVALGTGAVADRKAMSDYATSGYDMLTGKAYAGAGYDSAVWRSNLAAVSVGEVLIDSATPLDDDKNIVSDAKQTRQITGVAAGSADTDLVNVAQLKAAGFLTDANEGGGAEGLAHRLTQTWNVRGGYGSDFESSAQIKGYSGRNLAAKAVQDGSGNNVIHVQENESPEYARADGGRVTINTNGQGTINGLTNTSPVNRRNYTSGQVATEDQLVQRHFNISANGKTTGVYGDETVFFVGDDNIHVNLGGSTVSIQLDRDLRVQSITINNGGPRMDAAGVNMANRPITNLPDGVDRYDAVNKRQLDGMDDRLRAGVATAVAQANIPQVITPGASMLGAGIGYFRDQAALGLGWSVRSDNGRWVWRSNLGLNSEEVVMNSTIGFEF